MKKYTAILAAILLVTMTWSACKKSNYPIDEDGLIISDRSLCFVSNFEMLGTDYVTVRSKPLTIDTVAQTISIELAFGTDLKNLYPQFTLATDCKLDPKIEGKVDFSDLANPRQWTVVSGNRQIRKPYKVLVTVQPR